MAGSCPATEVSKLEDPQWGDFRRDLRYLQKQKKKGGGYMTARFFISLQV